jgi:DNA-binding NarL/FixJ family response regulator
VLLADDHTMFRQGLAGILARYGAMEVVAEVPNDEDALRLARRLAPDVVVMQVQMPVERARQTLEAMRSFPNPPRVVIVTMLESPRHVGALVGAKANAYLLKSDSAEHLIATVRAPSSTPRGPTRWWGCPPPCWRAQTGRRGRALGQGARVLLLRPAGLSNAA